MKRTHLFLYLAALITVAAPPCLTWAHGPAEEMTEAANTLLAALSDEQKAKATFDWKDDERMNWHFIPRARKGLPWKEMTPEQQLLAHGLLSSGMSHRGYFKSTTIMSLEKVLADLERGGTMVRDEELYYVSIFGKPTATGTWGWRIEGHHLSLNFTLVQGKAIAGGPSFFGANPAEIRSGPRKGLRVLAAEEDLARKLVQSLNAEQKKTAIYDTTAPSDIITRADRKARLLEPNGLSMAKMTKQQAELAWKIIQEYARRARPELADKDLERIQNKGFENVYFAWAGPTEPGQGHYYRIQGPTFLLEYDNTQNNANHIHAVWRDLENDFGEDLLKQHYEKNAH